MKLIYFNIKIFVFIKINCNNYYAPIFICEKCGSDMRIVAFIMELEQIDRIMQHLINRGRAPPGITESSTI
jgi:hypothetical protein